jgi:hypothetical protein
MVEDHKVEMSTVLWDSGALHSSYISQQWVHRHREALQNRIRKEETMVRLGDSRTRVHLNEKRRLEIEDTSPVNTLYRRRAGIDFCVMEMKGMDGIIGLPDILDHFLDIFVEILVDGRHNRSGVEPMLNMSEVDQLEEKYEDLEQPWKKQLDEVAQ